jgi:predicted SAM-dependent methyltransferase
MKDRLNLGSGKSYLPDCVNVDVRLNVGADIVADIRTVEFPPESFSEILCSDVLAHIKYVEARQVLRKCYGWLKPNGALWIHTPNLRFLAGILSHSDNEECLRWMYGSSGEGTTNYEENLIRWAYSAESLTRILTDIGFTVASVKSTCHGFGLHVIAIKK